VEDKAKGLVAALKRNGYTITTAESCTGGRIAGAITSVPGSSKVFPGAVVSYWDQVKHRLLGVPEDLLENYGAVSEPVARAMAQGAAQLLGTDLALSATGLAGPEGDGISPVGTVYLGVYFQGDTFVRCFVFPGDRAQVQRAAAEKALELALEALK
jgi:PncC family amidohydrolase